MPTGCAVCDCDMNAKSQAAPVTTTLGYLRPQTRVMTITRRTITRRTITIHHHTTTEPLPPPPSPHRPSRPRRKTTSLPHRLQRLCAAPRAQHSFKCARAFVSFWGHCAALRTLRDLKMSTRTQCTDRHRVSWPLLRGARSTTTRLHEIVNSGITSRGRRG